MKNNSDGAINSDKTLAADGLVAREGAGFIGARCGIYKGITDPLIIEALAPRDAFKFSVEERFQPGYV